jgi:hypothetical protein
MIAAVLGPGSGLERWRTPAEAMPEAQPARQPEPSEASGTNPAGAFQSMVHALGKEIDRGESRVREALSGAATRSFSSVDLIVLQADIYRYIEAVDLAARMVDRAGQAIRTTLQSPSG